MGVFACVCVCVCVSDICMFFSLQVMPLADFFFRSRRWEISLSTPSGRMKSKGAFQKEQTTEDGDWKLI